MRSVTVCGVGGVSACVCLSVCVCVCLCVCVCVSVCVCILVKQFSLRFTPDALALKEHRWPPWSGVECLAT